MTSDAGSGLAQAAAITPVVLQPDLNAADGMWRSVFRDVRFRRALSLGLDRDEINRAVFSGRGVPSNNTLREGSPLFREEYRIRYAQYDPAGARRLLDDMGVRIGDGGLRLLPDGRPMHLVIETAGETVSDNDVLSLIRDHWSRLGIGL